MRKFLFCTLAVLLTLHVWAQRTVTGVVTDDRGTPVPNASVQIKGTNLGTVTGPDGRFSLNVPAEARTLVFSAVDMATQEIALGSGNTVDARLRTSERSLEEVVVVGYGTQRRKEITGNIASVSGRRCASFQLTQPS